MSLTLVFYVFSAKIELNDCINKIKITKNTALFVSLGSFLLVVTQREIKTKREGRGGGAVFTISGGR
jgi:hypothetical protein